MQSSMITGVEKLWTGSSSLFCKHEDVCQGLETAQRESPGGHQTIGS